MTDNKVTSIFEKNSFPSSQKASIISGGGGGGDGMESRIAKLEAHVEHLQSDVTEIKGDVKLLTQASHRIAESIGGAKIWAVLLYVGLAAVLLGVMAKGFGWLK